MLSRHLHPAGILELNAPEFRAVWKNSDGSPELYVALITDLDAGKAGTPAMARQDVWDREGTNTDFKLSCVLQAEPEKPKGAPKTRFHPCPAQLVGYETVSSMTCGLGDALQEGAAAAVRLAANVSPAAGPEVEVPEAAAPDAAEEEAPADDGHQALETPGGDPGQPQDAQPELRSSAWLRWWRQNGHDVARTSVVLAWALKPLEPSLPMCK